MKGSTRMYVRGGELNTDITYRRFPVGLIYTDGKTMWTYSEVHGRRDISFRDLQWRMSIDALAGRKTRFRVRAKSQRFA